MSAERLSRRDLGRLLTVLPLTALPLTVRSPARAARSRAVRSPARAVRSPARSWRVTGRALPGLAEFDAVVKAFMRSRGVSCGALAVARHGRLVLARGYTWSADAALTTRPTSLFRVASVTKPITATVVLRLVQDGHLALTDRVTGLLGLRTPADPRLHDVTVRHLLRHRGGWDREATGDPLFEDPVIARGLGKRLPIDRDDIVAHVTARRLDHAPGSAFAYSNYGYLLLGRVVERVTGTPYADQVRRTVFDPLGIRRARMGRTLVPAPGEVPYFSQYTAPTVMDSSGRPVPGPYGSFNHENNAFNCGWLASAVDLVRFARVYDGTTTVLGAETAGQALASPEPGRNGRYYGYGWHVSPGRFTWHNGSLPGTWALLVRRFDGLAWAILFDQRDDPSGERYGEIGGDLHDVVDDIERWPDGDLGDDYH